MPRRARKQSETGIYHVMLRGIDRQLIFEDSEDYIWFLDIVEECREVCNFQLYAYCLMGNHVHLLLKVQDEGLETIFKRIGGRYVYYYNVKYQRVGHLFQDRFIYPKYSFNRSYCRSFFRHIRPEKRTSQQHYLYVFR